MNSHWPSDMRCSEFPRLADPDVDTAVGADPALQYALMLLADARLPAGGHVMSAGLEPALAAGVTAEEIPAYLRARMATTMRVDAATAVVARHACETDSDLGPVAHAWAARTPVAALRDIGHVAGRGLYRVFAHIEPVAAARLRPLVRDRMAWRPVVLGALAHALGLAAPQTALLVAYDDVQTVTSAALKLLPLDPLDTLAWSLAARAGVTELVGDTAGLTDAADIPADSAPQLEAWHRAHASADRRLFRA